MSLFDFRSQIFIIWCHSLSC